MASAAENRRRNERRETGRRRELWVRGRHQPASADSRLTVPHKAVTFILCPFSNTLSSSAVGIM